MPTNSRRTTQTEKKKKRKQTNKTPQDMQHKRSTGLYGIPVGLPRRYYAASATGIAEHLQHDNTKTSILVNDVIAHFGGLMDECPELLFRVIPRAVALLPSNRTIYVEACRDRNVAPRPEILALLSSTVGAYELEELDCGGLPLGDDGVLTLVPLLDRNPRLRVLSLRGCGVVHALPAILDAMQPSSKQLEEAHTATSSAPIALNAEATPHRVKPAHAGRGNAQEEAGTSAPVATSDAAPGPLPSILSHDRTGRAPTRPSSSTQAVARTSATPWPPRQVGSESQSSPARSFGPTPPTTGSPSTPRVHDSTKAGTTPRPMRRPPPLPPAAEGMSDGAPSPARPQTSVGASRTSDTNLGHAPDGTNKKKMCSLQVLNLRCNDRVAPDAWSCVVRFCRDVPSLTSLSVGMTNVTPQQHDAIRQLLAPRNRQSPRSESHHRARRSSGRSRSRSRSPSPSSPSSPQSVLPVPPRRPSLGRREFYECVAAFAHAAALRTGTIDLEDLAKHQPVLYAILNRASGFAAGKLPAATASHPSGGSTAPARTSSEASLHGPLQNQEPPSRSRGTAACAAPRSVDGSPNTSADDVAAAARGLGAGSAGAASQPSATTGRGNNSGNETIAVAGSRIVATTNMVIDANAQDINFFAYLTAMFPMFTRAELVAATQRHCDYSLAMPIARSGNDRVRKEWRREIDDTFQLLDKDRDGLLSRREMCAALPASGVEVINQVYDRMQVEALTKKQYADLLLPCLIDNRRRKRWK